MRRKEREVKDSKKIDDIIAECKICRLGFNNGGKIYVVPLNFGFVKENGKRILYFHSAREGKKIELIMSEGYAGFEMDTGYSLISGKKACDYTAGFRSIIGGGKISVVNDNSEKLIGLKALMNSAVSEKKDWSFDEKWFKAVCVIRLEIEEISCKENLCIKTEVTS